jgi:ribosome-associated protein
MEHDNEYDDRDDRPSKSARKREAHALQKLGERLVQMRPQDVVGLPLGDTLREAITEARRLSGTRGALARQYQYIGKLMRGEDLPAIEAALTALEVARNPRGKIAR